MIFKKISYSFLAASICLSSFAHDGNDRISFKIESTENRVLTGAFLQKIEDYADAYVPPVINDFVSYTVSAIAAGITDGSQLSLREDLTQLAQERLQT